VPLEHELGEVKAHTEHLAATGPQKGEQAAVARPQVEDATSVARHMLEQDALSLGAARGVVGPGEIPTDMLGGGPFLGGQASLSASSPEGGGSAPVPAVDLHRATATT
jgi:hypothetical protein